MTIDTLDGLVAALRDSGLLDEEQQRQVPALAVRFPDPPALARQLEHLGWLTSYQAEELLAGRGDELVLGQYVILSLLGQGGMGKVLKARHRLMKRVVALKVIRSTLLADPRAVQRFRREIAAVSQLDHPNIVSAFDANQIGNTHFLVMEFVEGTDLARLVKEHGPLPVGLACNCIRQAALGLQHAHEQRMVHRDIKPANLLLSRSAAPGLPAVVKILDMGLARLHAEEGDGLTHTGAIMGTPDYIAPEQASDSHQVDIRADLYSLGCTFYYLLTGEPPFPGGTAMEKLFKHQYVSPRPVEVRRPELPSALTAIVGRLLAKRAEERFQTPAELAEALAPLSVISADEEVATIYLPRPAPVAEVGPGTMRPSAPAGETMHPEAAATGVDGASREPDRGTGKTPGDWSAGPVPYVEPALPAGAVPAGAELQLPPARPRRRGPVLLATVVVLAGAVVVAAVALPSLSSLWQRPASSGRGTFAGEDGGRTFATTHSEDTSQGESTRKGPSTERAGPVTAKAEPKDTVKQGPKDSRKEKPEPPPLQAGVVLTIPAEMEIKQAAFASGGKAAVLSSSTTNLLGFCYGFDGNTRPIYQAATISAAGLRTIASAVAISGDGKSAFYASLDRPPDKVDLQNVIGLWRPPDGAATALKTSAPTAIKCLSVSENGLFVLGGTESLGINRSDLYWWDVTDPKDPKQVKIGGHGKSPFVQGVGLSGDGTRAVSCANGDGVRLWEIKADPEKLKHAWITDAAEVSVVAISPSGKYVLFCDDNNILHLLDFNSGTNAMKAQVKAPFVKSLAIVEKAKKPLWVVCGNQFGDVSMWDAQTGKPVTLEGKPHGKEGDPLTKKEVLAVAISPDYKYVYSLGRDNTIRRWLIPEPPK
jgi:tRNA A-37 threonylcarbamoyl transferase component Bud32